MTGAIAFDASQTWPTFNQNTTGSAATLATGRTIALTGDVTYTSGSFNGSANVTGTATLANSGVTAGTYGNATNIPQFAVDAKGRVTSVSNVAVSIPSGSLTFTGDVTGTGSTGSSTGLTLAGVGTAGTYTKVTTDSKGRVTSGTTLVAGDIPALDASKITSGTIDAARLPSYVDDVVEAANLASFPATGETGKIYVALDTNKVYRWSGSTYVYITSGAVDSVAGKTGVVTLVKADVGLGSVDNTSDAAKPVSTAQQTALNLKANLASPTFTGIVGGITAAMVGLGSVENKSSATIRSEISSANVTGALGFTPYNSTNPSGYITSSASITGTAANVTGTVAAANGGTGLTSPGTAGNVLTSNGTTWTSSAPGSSLPSQSGNSGKFLYSNGSTASWQFAALPPTAPTNLSAGADSLTSIRVSYTQGASGTENRIYYSTTSPVTTSSAYVVGGVSSGTITGLTVGTTYFIAVATHSIISTSLSTQITAATPPAGTAVYTSGQTLDVTSGTGSFLAGSGVTSIKIEVTGGSGGGGGSWNSTGAGGGAGGSAAAIYNLSGGTLFTYYVGGGGSQGCQYAQSGHGGGASAVVFYDSFTPVVVAGGGGGGGDGWNGSSGIGGAGGSVISQNGPFVGNGTNGQTTQSAGGGGGSSVPGTNSANSAANAIGRVGGKGGNQGGSGGGGTSGYGEGGSYSTGYFWAGGGGGGGYFGGAGGWGSNAGDGGGGGSSYIATGCSSSAISFSPPPGTSGSSAGGSCGGAGQAGRVKITFI
jgi:hypothetical protein